MTFAYEDNLRLLLAWGWLVLIVVSASLALGFAIRSLTRDEAEDEFYAVREFDLFRDDLGEAVRR